MELSADVGGDTEDLDDVQSRTDDIEMMAREMEEQEMQDPGEILRHLQQNLGEHQGERGPSNDPTLQYSGSSS